MVKATCGVFVVPGALTRAVLLRNYHRCPYELALSYIEMSKNCFGQVRLKRPIMLGHAHFGCLGTRFGCLRHTIFLDGHGGGAV